MKGEVQSEPQWETSPRVRPGPSKLLRVKGSTAVVYWVDADTDCVVGQFVSTMQTFPVSRRTKLYYEILVLWKERELGTMNPYQIRDAQIGPL
jgi:hypothetical protein